MLRFTGVPSWMLELDWLFYLLLYPLITALCSFSPQITFARGQFILLLFQRTNSKIYHCFSFSDKLFSYFYVSRIVVAAHLQFPLPFILHLFAPCMGGTSQSGIWSDFLNVLWTTGKKAESLFTEHKILSIEKHNTYLYINPTYTHSISFLCSDVVMWLVSPWLIIDWQWEVLL